MEVLSSFIKELPCWLPAALGFYIAFRVLRYPDLTVDASFIAGTVAAGAAAISCSSTIIGLGFALFLSAFAGAMTGVIYLSNPRPAYKLLSGVLVYLTFYSINYRILGRKTYDQFSDSNTIINRIADFEAQHGLWNFRPITVTVGISIVVGLFFFYRWFLKTSLGLRIRAVGSRPYLVANSRGRVGRYTVLGLVLSNMTVGIGGWFYGSMNGNTTINVFGTILHVLAAAIIGELVIERLPKFKDRTTSVTTILSAPIIGGLIYFFIRAWIIWFIVEESNGNDPNKLSLSTQDVNALIAFGIIILIMAVRLLSEKLHEQTALEGASDDETI